MKKYTPYQKLSKRKQREADEKHRRSWSGLNPVTRKTADLKLYNRAKARVRNDDDSEPGLFSFSSDDPSIFHPHDP